MSIDRSGAAAQAREAGRRDEHPDPTARSFADAVTERADDLEQRVAQREAADYGPSRAHAGGKVASASTGNLEDLRCANWRRTRMRPGKGSRIEREA